MLCLMSDETAQKATHTLRLRPEDHNRVQTICSCLGLATYTEAIRYALAVGAARAAETGPAAKAQTG